MIKVVIVDGKAALADMLRRVLDDSLDIKVVGTAATLAEGVTLAREMAPDVIISELRLPDGVVYDRLPALRAVAPHVKVLIATASHDDDAVSRALSAGALGYLLTDQLECDIAAAVRSVDAGHCTLAPSLVFAQNGYTWRPRHWDPPSSTSSDAPSHPPALVIDEWSLIAHGLRALLRDSGFPAVVVCTTVTEGLTHLGEVQHLVIMGQGPDIAQAEAVRELAQRGHLVVGLVNIARDVVSLYRAGALAVMERGVDADELRVALERVVRGRPHVTPSLIDAVVRSRPTKRSRTPHTHGLTRRERDVLAHLASGRTNKEIARALTVSPETVNTHLDNIYIKLGVNTRQSAVAFALQKGLT